MSNRPLSESSGRGIEKQEAKAIEEIEEPAAPASNARSEVPFSLRGSSRPKPLPIRNHCWHKKKAGPQMTGARLTRWSVLKTRSRTGARTASRATAPGPPVH